MTSLQISEEMLLLIMSMYTGLILIICYDVVRIFRRLLKAGKFRVLLEDIIFWTAASIFTFNMLIKYNYGRPGYFAIAGILGTMWLFECFLGKYFVEKTAFVLNKIMNTLLKPLKKAVKVIKLKYKRIINSVRKKVRKWHSKEDPGNTLKEKKT